MNQRQRGGRDEKRTKVKACKTKRNRREGIFIENSVQGPSACDICTELIIVCFHSIDEDMEAKRGEVS